MKQMELESMTIKFEAMKKQLEALKEDPVDAFKEGAAELEEATIDEVRDAGGRGRFFLEHKPTQVSNFSICIVFAILISLIYAYM
jgi:hypothetical protein